MCNIAGYVGERRAAPILLEMLRRQQKFDGAMTVGIATLHEGKIYLRKAVGDVDTLINTTDALNLPGTIGIAHTRPGGTPETLGYAHPYLTGDGVLAGMTNGTAGTFENYRIFIQGVTTELYNEGYVFNDRVYAEKSSFPRLPDGSSVSCVLTRTNMVRKNIDLGMSLPEAITKMASDCYVDHVFGALYRETPDRFYVVRTTRPSVVVTNEDGTYMASTRFAFDEGMARRAIDLPLMHPCTITKGGFEVGKETISGEPVGAITPEGFEAIYAACVELMRGRSENPLVFDDLEFFMRDNTRQHFTGSSELFEYARVVYDVLYRMKNEGLLRMRSGKVGNKPRYLMWID